MSNVFGNRGGGGGFANPATTNLNMNSIYKIVELANGTDPGDAINLSQLTTYNPFNQSLNTTDNVQFQNVNMNGNWNIPNTQPASINDPNLYIISAQGGLVTIPVGPSFTIKAQMSASPQVDVVIPIPHMAYSYLDLCQLIQNSYNTNTIDVIYRGTMTICQYGLGGYLIIEITRELIHLAGTFIIVYDGPNTPSSALGYTATFTTPCNTIAVAQSPLVFSTFVGWKALGSSTTPITNGSPYIYSSSQDKWYCSENLYTPDFLSYMDFNNSSYNLFQNGTNRLKINATDAYIYSPNSLNFVNVSNAGMSVVQNSMARVSSTAFSTYMMAPNGITDCSVSNNGVGFMVDTVARFSALSASNTTIKSFDDTMTLTLASNSFTAATSTDNKILLTSSGFTYAHNNIQKMIMNANNFVVSNGATPRLDVSGSNSIISAPAGLNRLYLDDSLMKYDEGAQNRLIIDTVRSRVISPSGVYTLESNNSGVGLVANGTTRMGISGFQSYVYSPDYHSLFANTNTYITMEQGGFTKFLMNEDPLIGTSLWGPSGSGKIELLNSRINLRQNSVNRFVINNAETYSFAPSLLNYSYKSDTEMANFFNSVNRFSIGSTSTIFKSPDTNNYIDINNNGLTYTDAGTNRLSISDTTTYIAAPSSSTYCSVANTGASITVDALNRFTASSGGNTTIKSFDNTTTVTLAGDNFTASTTTNSLVVNADFNYYKGAQLRIHADSSHSQLLSPNGLQAVEANNTGVQINLGTDNYKLPTTRGTVGQVLTYSGINTTWSTPSITPGAAINSGWGYLPMSSITATATAATRSFYYISMVPMNTVITGIKAYINTAGADFINCAIYRGKSLVAGSQLVMTSGRVTVLSVCDVDEYMTLPLTLQSGQSNVFTAGEYVTICYHSSGSGAVYYICAAAPANLGISYISTACYASAGTPTFPANLSLITPSTTNTIRTHFEFY